MTEDNGLPERGEMTPDTSADSDMSSGDSAQEATIAGPGSMGMDGFPRMALSMLGIVAAGVIVKNGESVLIPMTVAFFLMLMLQPLADWTAKRVDSFLFRFKARLGRKHKSEESALAKAFSIILVLLVFAILSFGIYVLIRGQITLILSKQSEIINNIFEPIKDWMTNSGLFGDADAVAAHLNSLAESALSIAPSAALPIVSVVFTFVMILFLTTFLLIGRRNLEKNLENNSQYARIEHIVGRVESNTRKFILTKIITSLMTGLGVAGGLVLFGFLDLQDAIIWGSVYFVMNFIPIYGSMIAGVGTILYTMAIYDPNNFLSAWPVIPLVMIINISVSNGIEPKLMQKTLPIGSVTVLFVVILWAWLWGPWGMFLAVPLTIIFKVMLEEIRGTKYWLCVLMET